MPPRWDELIELTLDRLASIRERLIDSKLHSPANPADAQFIEACLRRADDYFWTLTALARDFASANINVQPADEPAYREMQQDIDAAGSQLQSARDLPALGSALQSLDRNVLRLTTLHTHGPGEGEPQ